MTKRPIITENILNRLGYDREHVRFLMDLYGQSTDVLTLLKKILIYVSVSDITNPIEIKNEEGVYDGQLLIAESSGEFTLYCWNASQVAENIPYIIDGSTGSWYAEGGKYINDDLSLTELNVTDLNADHIDFDTAYTGEHQDGRAHWDPDNGCLAIDMPGGNVELQVGEENLVYVKNTSGATITNGMAVYVSGASGTNIEVGLASNTSLVTARVLGLATEDLTNNELGYVTTFGVVHDVDTSAFSAGDILWLGVNGNLTTTRPAWPTQQVAIGVCIRSNANVGEVYVSVYVVPWALNGLYLGDYSGGDYSEFEADGTLIFYGDAVVYKDQNFSGFTAGAVASAPSNVLWDSGTIYTKAFDGTATTEQLYAACELQHHYEEGTDLVFHIHWSPTTANAGNVEWFIDYTVEKDATGTSASGTLSVVDAAGGTAWVPQRVNIGTITGTTFNIGNQIGIRLYRVPTGANDTYPDDAALSFTFGYHYRVNSVGSRSIGTKA